MFSKFSTGHFSERVESNSELHNLFLPALPSAFFPWGFPITVFAIFSFYPLLLYATLRDLITPYTLDEEHKMKILII
jgi:hypothetical protein